MDLAFELERAVVGPEGARVVLAVRCSHAGRADRSPDLSIAAALDRSTSMRGQKLSEMKEAARALVEALGPRDRLVLVAFDQTVEVLGAGPVVDRRPSRAAIDEISVRNGTNLSLALETSGRYLAGDDSGNVKRVFLLTDGQASVGIQDREGLAAIARDLATREIATTALGFGLSYDEDVLSAIAHAGGGRLHHVTGGAARLASIYSSELARLRALAARWIEVEVAPAPGVTVLGSRNAYPETRERGILKLACSDLRLGESRWVLVDLKLPSRDSIEATPDSSVEVARATVRWTDVEDHRHEKVEPLTVRYADAATAAAATPNGQVLRQLALLEAAQAKERALEDSDRGDFESGSVRLKNSLFLLERSARAVSFGTDAALEEEIQRLGKLAAALAKGPIDAEKRKEIRVQIHDGKTPTYRVDVGDGPPPGV